ncbi:MAG: ribonuclease J [Bacilli bacterium]|nr:ribonuclease J [Bacilli bacterium]
MADLIKVCALSGLDEEGRDCYLIEINNDIFVVDCGMSMPDKTIPGIDSILPNFEYLIKNKNRVKAYIITHGHDEEIGALKYFYPLVPAPIYCTFAASQFIVSQADIYKVKVKFDFKIVKPTDDVNIAGHRVRFFQTCHNMCESQGVAFSTDRGNIIYTSDFIVDFTVKDKDFCFDTKAITFLSEEPTLMLLAESKCAHIDGYCAPHHRVTRKISKYFTDSNKRIFVSCFWQNIFRIYEIISLAKVNGKKIYLFDNYTKNIVQTLMNVNILPITNQDIIPTEDLLRVRNQDVVVLMLGHREDIYKKMIKLSSGLIDDKRLVLSKDDIFINASIPTAIFDVIATKAIDALFKTGCEVINLKRKDMPSMHARQDDLKYFLSLLRPKYYVPVRGSYKKLIANAKLALSMDIGLNHMNVFILDNGSVLNFDNSPRPYVIPSERSGINVAPILVDGKGISMIGDEIINDRRKLGVDGVVMLAIAVSKDTKQICAGPDCQMRGFVFVKEAEPLLKSLSQIFIEEVKMVLAQGSLNFEKAIANTKERCKRFIRKENGRDPHIIATVNII